jgi:hypothetical protein
MDWVVELGGCQEAVIRSGESLEDVSYPDDLGCPVLRIRPLHQVQLKPGPLSLWRKGDELRCELV